MPATRCTCIYRAANLAEKDDGHILVRLVADPDCRAPKHAT